MTTPKVGSVYRSTKSDMAFKVIAVDKTNITVEVERDVPSREKGEPPKRVSNERVVPRSMFAVFARAYKR